MNFCTHCDKNYFYKAFALYKSLTEQCESFTLHWLCNDEDTYNCVTTLNLPNIVAYSLAELENNEDLAKAKNNPPSRYGDQYSQYMWTLTPYFTNHLLSIIPKGEKLMYCDADIFFYRNPRIIFDIVGDKSAGIHTHRFGGKFRDQDNGWYNVGVMVFTNNDKGKEVSDKWKSWLLNPNNEYYAKYGTCGDQKYLELIKDQYEEDVCVFDDIRCSHLAPWNCSNLRHSENKMIEYNGDWSPVVFFHFSHFNINIETGQWRDSNNGEWSPARDYAIQKYYNAYALSIKALHERYLQ